MNSRGRFFWEQGGHFTAPQAIILSVLTLAAGCRLLPTHFPPAAPETSTYPSGAVLVRQVVVDSALALVRSPLRCLCEFAHEGAHHLCAQGQGEIGKRILLPFEGSAESPLTCHADAAVLSIQELEGLKEECLPPANIRLLVDGTQALSALEELLTRATQQIDVIMFMWEDDEVGRRVADLLSSKAKSGVRVRVLIDGGGNCIFGQPEEAPVGQINHAVCALAQQPGISVLRIHNPFGRFDHRKLVLADGQIAWSGGRNFVERAFFIQHDLSFTLAGPPVGQLQHLFNKCWRQQGGAESASNPGRGMEHRTECPLEGSSNARVRLLVTEPGSHQLGACLYRAVDSARHRIYLENVYLNDSLLVYKLARARQRGVDVRVVLTLVSPTKAINWANRVTANRLLKEGVRVYIYPTMTHVKAALVDDSWAYLGTANFDALSLRHNYELGFAIEAGSLIGEIEERLFLPDCCSEWELKRPLTVSLKDYACELVASLCL